MNIHTLTFGGLEFEIADNKIRLNEAFGYKRRAGELGYIAEVQVAGENHNVHGGAKHYRCSQSESLEYIGHTIGDNTLDIVQQDSLIRVTTRFTRYPGTNALSVYNTVENISGRPLTLEYVSSFVFYGIGKRGIDSVDELYLYRFTNSWHVECQPRRHSLYELGLFRGSVQSMKRVCGFNSGGWSTKEELPQAIIEDAETGKYFMFQIESSSSWYWELCEQSCMLYLIAGGPDQQFGQVSKTLAAGEKFQTVTAAVCCGDTLNGVLSQITVYRRHIVCPNAADRDLPSIFNEYMYLSWDNPYENRTMEMAKTVAKLGIKYYVIDCGWHDEEDSVYPYVGKWRESRKRFPSGIRYTADYLRSLGLKVGLWIEPESFGYLCEGMENIYDDSCFFSRNGRRVLNMNRYQLDFRNSKVRTFMTETIARMVEEYGADYIKFDYNQCCGAGTDKACDSLGDGLLSHRLAYSKWLTEIMERFPNVIFENCASGGLRMDYDSLSAFSIQSVSDQTDYKKYPYIVGNMMSAVLPEQAGVWSYPIADYAAAEKDYAAAVSDELVIFNMINSLLGRMHLASHLELMPPSHTELVKQAVNYYDYLSPYKKQGLPYLPLGFTDFRKQFVAAGFYACKKMFLALWNLDSKGKKTIELPEQVIISAIVGYPFKNDIQFSYGKHFLTVEFSQPYTARLFELELE